MKSEVNELDINKLVNVPTSWDISKRKVDDLDVGKLKIKNFKERLKQAKFVSETVFDNTLRSFNRKITSNKPKYLEVQE